MAGADVIKKIKQEKIKFIDLRFTDTKGKEQHVTVPASAFDKTKFTDGHAFDGSSIAGWKGINASDMLLFPDPNTANIDPFMEEKTLILTCNVEDPTDGKGYDRDPRTIANRAEKYLKTTGIGDTIYFGPEPEFFVFDDVKWKSDMSGSSVNITLKKQNGTLIMNMMVEMLAIVLKLRVVTFQYLLLIHFKTFDRKCA